MKLNDTHLILLTTASQRDNGSLIPLPASLGDAADRVRKAIAALLKNGLVEEGEVPNAADAWRQNGDTQIGVSITPAGLSAIGMEPDRGSSDNATEAMPPRQTKVGEVLALLQRDEGATLDELVTTTGLRGHSSLFAALDAAIAVERTSNSRTWRIDKAKDGEDGATHGFKLESVVIGTDDFGEEATSAVVVSDHDAVPSNKPLSNAQKLALQTFHEAANTAAVTAEDGSFLGVHVEAWREAFYRSSPADNAPAKRQAFRRSAASISDFPERRS